MPRCEKCNDKFPNWVKIAGKRRNLGGRKYCLKCSPFGRHNTTQLKDSDVLKKAGACTACGRNFTYNRGNRGGARRDTCASCVVKGARVKLLLKVADYAGKACKVCGYDRCFAAIEFHHKDPASKLFSIAEACRKTRAWEAIRAELDKCLALCCRCHRELHAGLLMV
jgi:hypothetical protein